MIISAYVKKAFGKIQYPFFHDKSLEEMGYREHNST
jgi:hypothetical protein